MDKRPCFSSRISNTRQNRRIWKWDHFTFGDGIHRMATNGTYLSSFCYKKHVIGPQKLNEACKNQATMSSRIILIFHLNAQNVNSENPHTNNAITSSEELQSTSDLVPFMYPPQEVRTFTFSIRSRIFKNVELTRIQSINL